MKRSASASRSSVLIPGRRISRMRASVPATIRPARLMMSISRGDFNVIMLSLEHLTYSLGDLLHRPDGGNTAQQVALLIPVEHGSGLFSVRSQPGGHCRGIIVGPLLDR